MSRSSVCVCVRVRAPSPIWRGRDGEGWIGTGLEEGRTEMGSSRSSCRRRTL